MKRRFPSFAESLLACALCAAVPKALAAPPAAPSTTPSAPTAAAQSNLVSLNFVNADIQEVVRAISQISQKNFLIDPRVKGTINIVSATPVAPALAYEILLSALRLQGYAAVEAAGITKIVPEADAKQQVDAIGLDAGKNGSIGDKLVTRVFVLKNESATQLVGVVKPLLATSSVVTAYPAGNALVVTDYASSLKRVERLIAMLDQPGDDGRPPLVIPVKYMSALDLAATINRLMPEATAAQPAGIDANQRFVLLADSRINALLLRADNPDRVARVKKLAAMLDVETSTPGNIHVVSLKNADAAKLAQTLGAVLTGTNSSGSPSSSSSSAGSTGGSSSGSASALTTSPQATQPFNGTTASNSGSVVSASGGGASIQADVPSNTLIVTAPEPIYNNLRAVIDRLDVRRPQVFVEALIVELTASKAGEFGVQWQSLSGLNNSGTNVIGGTNFSATGNNILAASSNVAGIGQGLNIGVIKGTVNIPGVGTVLNMGALAHALESDTNANILSAPTLMTLDNEEAKIVVGQNVPFVTGQYAQTGNTNTATPFQTIERKDVGLTLSIKPQITQGGTVKMYVYQEVSSVAPTTSDAGIITNKRSIESSILVDENQIVVLGGLIQDSINNVQNRVPLLGSLPLIGWLFRYETREHAKTNLMVFIRPYVMYGENSYQSLTEDRYRQMSKTLDDSHMPDSWVLPDDRTKMPPLPAPTPAKPADGARPSSMSEKTRPAATP